MSDILMTIEVVGGELEMTVHSDNLAEQKARRGEAGRNQRIKKLKQQRRHDNSNNGGNDHEDVIGPHLPVILIDKTGITDIVTWKCDQPFIVDVEANLSLQDPTGPAFPRTPFGWTLPQSSTLQTNGAFNGFHTVTGTFVDKGAVNQKFYKCTVWCNDLKLDPDFICDR